MDEARPNATIGQHVDDTSNMIKAKNEDELVGMVVNYALHLKDVVEELESAIYSDVDSYRPLNVDYQDVLDYYNDTPNAEEGL